MTELTPGLAPEPVTLHGRYCRLEPLSPDHASSLFASVDGEGADERYRYLLSAPPESEARMREWIESQIADPDMMFFAVIDKKTGRCGGHQALMRIRPQHRSAEIGAVLWGRGVTKTRIATEAVYLFASLLFDELGYRRYEWKCNDRNAASKLAAIRFGFRHEGVFRQDMIVKGENRDTAWFSMLDREWRTLKPIYQTWLDPTNFDAEGRAMTRLATPRGP